jgi:hypothetical protein
MLSKRKLKYNFFSALCELGMRTQIRVSDIRVEIMNRTGVPQPTLSRLENMPFESENSVGNHYLRLIEKFFQEELYSDFKMTICNNNLPNEIEFQSEQAPAR